MAYRLGQTLRRLFFAFDSPLRRKLWQERLSLAHANSYRAADGTLRYEPLTDDQRARLDAIHRTLGTRGPTLLGLGFHQWFEGALRKIGID